MVWFPSSGLHVAALMKGTPGLEIIQSEKLQAGVMLGNTKPFST